MLINITYKIKRYKVNASSLGMKIYLYMVNIFLFDLSENEYLCQDTTGQLLMCTCRQITLTEYSSFCKGLNWRILLVLFLILLISVLCYYLLSTSLIYKSPVRLAQIFIFRFIGMALSSKTLSIDWSLTGGWQTVHDQKYRGYRAEE